MKKTIFTVVLVALLILGVYTQVQIYAEETTEATKPKVLMIAGDYNKPYEIIDGIAFIKTIQPSGKIFNADPISEAFNEVTTKDLINIAKNAGADAIINLSIQFSQNPFKSEETFTKRADLGKLTVIGTLIKFVK